MINNTQQEYISVLKILQDFVKKVWIDGKPSYPRFLVDNLENLSNTYILLGDGESKFWFLERVKFGLALELTSKEIAYKNYRGWQDKLAKFWDSNNQVIPKLKIFEEPDGNTINEVYLSQQYEIEQCKVSKNDIILDCGAYCGFASKYFFEKTLGTGKIIAVEPNRELHGVLVQNAPFAKVVSKGLSSKSGWASLINPNKDTNCAIAKKLDMNGGTIEVTTIDDLIKDLELNNIDFIKVDVEGAEQDVIAGAVNIMKTYKPKLAISGYHRADDFWAIPNLLKEIEPSYKIYFKHSSFDLHESVFFAV